MNDQTSPPAASCSSVEAPSGKSAESENFPVGSVLIAKRFRPHVARFYDFARAIDDIADAAQLSSNEKIRRLQGFEDALTGVMAETAENRADYAKAFDLRRSLIETKVTTQHGVDLIAAFKQDAVKNRYANWDELMGYCALSAAPVGRYLIDLHGGARSGTTAASDALCAALQVINHLQDCGDDYRDMDRVYLPLDWMKAEGADIEALGGASVTPALRRVIDRCLDGTRTLMETAHHLSADICDARLSMEAGVIIEIADALIAKLSKRDPLASPVKLTKSQLGVCGLRGVWRGVVAVMTRPPTHALPSPFANVPARGEPS